jgi:hypothetical protein
LPAQPNQPERYRAVFSDIENYVQTMLATRMCCPRTWGLVSSKIALLNID